MSAGEKKYHIASCSLNPNVHNSAQFYAKDFIILAGTVEEDQLWEVCSRSKVQRRTAKIHSFN
jgi:hypothetical protein